MRHFLLSKALALQVQPLPDGVREPPVEPVLIGFPGDALLLSPLRLGALLAAVLVPPVARAAQDEDGMTLLADQNP
jgi:hypothetical protein